MGPPLHWVPAALTCTYTTHIVESNNPILAEEMEDVLCGCMCKLSLMVLCLGVELFNHKGNMCQLDEKYYHF